MSEMSDTLLGPGDPVPVEILNDGADHPLLLVCEHAGRAIPARLGDLGLDAAARATHIGWDIGAAAVTRRLAEALGAPAVLQPYSRLVIDCNRPLDAPDSVPEASGGVVIPGNAGRPMAGARAREIFVPFQAEVTRLADARERRALLAIHSFTPSLRGAERPWEVGLLYRADAESSGRLAALLSARRPAMLIGMNQPYTIEDESDWFVPRHGERTGLPHSLIEIRQDLIGNEAEQAAWADLLAEVINDFLRGLSP